MVSPAREAIQREVRNPALWKTRAKKGAKAQSLILGKKAVPNARKRRD